VVTNTQDNDGNKTTRENKFIKRFNLPNSQMHYKPTHIISMDDGEVMMGGIDGLTNMKVNVKVTRSLFDSMLENYPESKFLLDNWNNKDIINNNDKGDKGNE